MNLLPNTNLFKTIPHQSGVYRVDLSILLNSHNNDVVFTLSGGGSQFFKFGANSGNYFVSGVTKSYFQATSPSVQNNYTFIIAPNQFDVYDGNFVPLVLAAPKNTGVCERIYTTSTSGANGDFELDVFGSRPSFELSSGMAFPVFNNKISSLNITNKSSVPFHILSGALSPISNINLNNNFPILLAPFGSGSLVFSGNLNTTDNQSKVVTLNTSFGNFVSNQTFSGSLYSGTGYVFTTPTATTLSLGSSTLSDFLIFNTGTERVTFAPQITNIIRPIAVGLPTYSGVAIGNIFSGIFDTTSKFFFSDRITWSGGEFNIIQQNQSGIDFLNITGESLITGLFLGSEEALSVGQSFNFPFDIYITGYSLKLAATGGAFAALDSIYTTVRRGHGTSGTIMGTSNSMFCSSIATGISSGSYYNFALPTPVFLESGNSYSIVVSGNPTWVGNSAASPNRKIILLQNTGNPYSNGSGFKDNGTVTFTGDAISKISWLAPTGANRYLINPVSGNNLKLGRITTGNYFKYMAEKNFLFLDTTILSLPNENKFFSMLYTGVVQGLNIVNIQFLGTNYNQHFSGVTT